MKKESKVEIDLPEPVLEVETASQRKEENQAKQGQIFAARDASA